MQWVSEGRGKLYRSSMVTWGTEEDRAVTSPKMWKGPPSGYVPLEHRLGMVLSGEQRQLRKGSRN